ncbi:MBL fold metallo-hydrolase [Streptomyces sp. NPDC046939]|uniref:MBL fold metallo-hydrolase n=1 Tax=Streptomyces sp. NPDC046939 TaxID=3155376 RepID=UPI003406929C
MGRASRLAFEEARPGDLTCGPFRLRLARVRHSVETYAVRVEDDRGSLTYTGDSGPCRELVEPARGSGVLLAEAALGPGDEPGAPPTRWDEDHTAAAPHHLTARQAAELASLAGVGLLALTHVRPWDDAGLALVAARCPAPVLLARPEPRLTPPVEPR